MRRHGAAGAYEELMALTRGRAVTAEDLRAFILRLDLPAEDKARLASLRPADYTGPRGPPRPTRSDDLDYQDYH